MSTITRWWGDNPERLRSAVEIAKGRANLIITTGGLGPTCDDLTKNVLADCFGRKLVFHQPSADRIAAYFAKVHPEREMTENNLQQAMLPEGCTVLDNDWGTAPGCAWEQDGITVIMLPGPPRECHAMLRYRVVPYLRGEGDQEGEILSRTLCLFGIGGVVHGGQAAGADAPDGEPHPWPPMPRRGPVSCALPPKPPPRPSARR